jgi:hypothetical protein
MYKIWREKIINKKLQLAIVSDFSANWVNIVIHKKSNNAWKVQSNFSTIMIESSLKDNYFWLIKRSLLKDCNCPNLFKFQFQVLRPIIFHPKINSPLDTIKMEKYIWLFNGIDKKIIQKHGENMTA